MSYEALNWAWKTEGLPSTQKFLLVALADFADEEHSCFPSQEKLAGMVGVRREAVSRNLAALESAGLISRAERRRRDGYRSSDRFTLAVGSRISCAIGSRDPKPDLMCDSSGSHVRETGGQEPSEEPSVNQTPIVPAIGDLEMAFEAFWIVYPRKAGKQAARRAFAKAVDRAEGWKAILYGAEKFASDPNLPKGDQRGFIPHPATWLNRDGWEDEPLPQRPGAQSVVGTGRSASEILAERARAAEGRELEQ